MAVTKEDILLNLIINEADALQALNAAIKSTDQLSEKIRATSDFAESMGTKFKVSAQQINEALRSANIDKVTAMFPKGASVPKIEGGVFGDQMEAVTSATSLELANRKAISTEQQKQLATQKRISTEEQKSANLTLQRKNILTLTLQDRQKEIMAIKNEGSYLQQVANAEKLINSLVKQTGSNANQVAAELKNSFGYSQAVVDTALGNITQKTKGFLGVLKDVFGNFRNYLSTAFGTFMAMILFQLQMNVQKFFTDVIKQAKDFGNTLQQLKLAEQILSEKGLEVTNKQLVELGNNLSKLYKTTARTDIFKTITDVALKLEDANLSLEQLGKVTQVVLDLKIKNPEQDIASLTDVVTRSLLTEEQKALTNLGIVMNERLVKQYALQHGIISDINDEMSTREKIQARLSYLVEKDSELQSGLLDQQNSLVNGGDRLSASWKNFTEQFAPLVNYWNALLVIASDVFDTWTEIVAAWNGAPIKPLTKFQEAMIAIAKGAISGAQAISFILTPALAIFGKQVGFVLSQVEKLYESITGRKFSDELDLGKLSKIDTPTNPNPPPPLDDESADEAEKNKKKIRDSLNDLAEALDEYGDKAREAQYKFNLMWGEGGREWQDYQHDVAKINEEANADIAAANAKHHQNELDNEAKFLEKLRQLREKFLFSLEDALRERDARQVLRLTRQYEMDKQNLINEEALRKKQDAASAAADIKKINDDRAKKLKELAYEFELKKRRAAEDHAAEMRQLEDDLQDRLRSIANNLAQELKLNADGADSIFKILSGYFGPNGNIEKITNYTYDSIVKKTQGAFQQILQLYQNTQKIQKQIDAQAQASTSSTSRPNSTQNTINRPSTSSGGINQTQNTIRRGMADGGALVAHSPTDIRFGEAGGEAAFIPISKLASMVNPQAKRPQSSSGKLDITVTISPELHATIVNDAVGEVANVFTTLQRRRNG